MPRNPGRQSYDSRFAPLVAYLATREEETVTLTLAQIEAIISGPLAVSAQVAPAFWIDRHTKHLPRELAALGWRARLRVKARSVEFRRTG